MKDFDKDINDLEDKDAIRQAFEDLLDKAERENVRLDLFFYNPEDEIILKRETIYILVIIALILGWIGRSLI